MKVRNGFVSNSSSSSFVVKFLWQPKSTDDVKTLLFGDEEYWPYERYNYQKKQDEIHNYSTKEISDVIWERMRGQDVTKEQVVEEILSGHHKWSLDAEDIPGYIDTGTLDEEWRKNERKYWKLADKANRLVAQKLAKDFFDEYDDENTTYIFEFSDNDGDFGSMMEHSGIFENAYRVIRNSKH